MQRTPEQEEQDGFIRGYHDIPDDKKLKKMSFAELSSELASCNSGSPKFIVIEREIKRHIARDQTEVARPNILLGAGIAGFFAIIGALIGGALKTCPPCQQVASAPAIQQVEKALPPPANVPANLVPSHNNTQPTKPPLSSAGQVRPQAADRSTEKN